MQFKITNEAQKDIENIWLYTFELWSGEQADRYFDLIFDEIEYIAKNPNSGKNYSHVRKNYLRSKVKSHFIFYKIDKKKAMVEIIRILHQQMDVETILNDITD